MSLVVLGGQDLDELEQWVSELYAAVPAGKGARPTFFEAGMPYKVWLHSLWAQSLYAWHLSSEPALSVCSIMKHSRSCSQHQDLDLHGVGLMSY